MNKEREQSSLYLIVPAYFLMGFPKYDLDTMEIKG